MILYHAKYNFWVLNKAVNAREWYICLNRREGSVPPPTPSPYPPPLRHLSLKLNLKTEETWKALLLKSRHQVQASLPLGSTVFRQLVLSFFFLFTSKRPRERDRGEIIIVWLCVRVSADEAGERWGMLERECNCVCGTAVQDYSVYTRQWAYTQTSSWHFLTFHRSYMTWETVNVFV